MYYLAIDIGASSGRHIVGYKKNGKIVLEELYRFPNGMDKVGENLVWDVDRLFAEIKKGIKIALEKYKSIKSLAIDTWGVDYVLMNGDKEILPVHAYRDARTKVSSEKVHQIIPFTELYSKTGIEFNEFNSIYQLYDDKLTGKMDNATDFLMLPEYFSYKLTGVKKKEYTEATTTGLVNALTHEFDGEIIDKLGLKKELFKEICQPRTSFGYFTEQVKQEVGGDIEVVMCASHDTASAVCGIDMQENAPYISSGTWSLLGVKTDRAITDRGVNISNEGGDKNTFRHQKNIMGMWLVNQLQKTLAQKLTVVEMISVARKSDYTEIFDVNDSSLVAPDNMKEAIVALLNETGNPPKDESDIINSVYHSLAKCYAQTFSEISNNIGQKFDKLYIVGGGAKNGYLNELTERYSGATVIAMPIEATALGNIKIQMDR